MDGPVIEARKWAAKYPQKPKVLQGLNGAVMSFQADYAAQLGLPYACEVLTRASKGKWRVKYAPVVRLAIVRLLRDLDGMSEEQQAGLMRDLEWHALGKDIRCEQAAKEVASRLQVAMHDPGPLPRWSEVLRGHQSAPEITEDRIDELLMGTRFVAKRKEKAK